MCYALLIPVHCCALYRHILDYRLAWRMCDEIMENHVWKNLCFFRDRDRKNITVIEPTNKWVILVDECTVCAKLLKRPAILQLHKRAKDLRKLIAKIKQQYRETRNWRNLASLMARTEGTQAQRIQYDHATDLLRNLRNKQDQSESEFALLTSRIYEAGRPFLDDQIHNARPQFENEGLVTYIYCGPLGEQEKKERDHKPIPPWLEKDAETMVHGLLDMCVDWAKPDPELRKVDPLKPEEEEKWL